MANQYPTPENYGFSLHNEQHRERFNRLKNRPWEATGFLDFSMLNVLGIQGGIQEMGKRIGWSDFLGFNQPTYKGLTLEFLSTLEVKRVRGGDIWKFQLGNELHQFNLAYINQIFAFPARLEDVNPAQTLQQFRKFVWPMIAALGENGAANRCNASDINHPCLRVFHSFMAHTIFGRGDKHELTQREGIVFRVVLMDAQPIINSAALMMEHLSNVAGRSTGSIAIGGLVTLIANHLRSPLEGRGINMNIIGPNRIESKAIDIALLKNLRVLYQCEQNYFWSLEAPGKEDPTVIQLPNAQRTLIRQGNWILQAQNGDRTLFEVFREGYNIR